MCVCVCVHVGGGGGGGGQILQRISLDIGPLYIHALPSLVLTVMLKGRGAPVVGWLGTLIVRATLPSPLVLVYMSVA